MDKWIDWIVVFVQPYLLLAIEYKFYIVAVISVLIFLVLLRGYGVKKLFKVPFWYFYIGSDVGGNTKPYFIYKKKVAGAPDAVFYNILKLQYVIGEFKSRDYKSYVKRREYYQVVLYVGLMSLWFLPRAKGIICYGCGAVVPIKYDNKVFKNLLSLRNEINNSKKYWQPENPTPLHQRD